MIDVNKFNERFDKYLEQETVESFDKWLKEKRAFDSLKEIMELLRKQISKNVKRKSNN